MKFTTDHITDYIIFRATSEDEIGIENLKLQKLLYYVQAWHLAFTDKTLFDGKFQAWIHGPVNRDVYNRFKDSKYLYSFITIADIPDMDVITAIPPAVQSKINTILDAYLPFSATELEEMTHREDPWINARKGFKPTQRCEVEIDEILMRDYYKKRLA